MLYNRSVHSFIKGVLRRANLPVNFMTISSLGSCNSHLLAAIHDDNKNNYELPRLLTCTNLGEDISLNFGRSTSRDIRSKMSDYRMECEENSYCGFSIGEYGLPFAFIDVCGQIIFIELVCKKFMGQHRNLFGKSIRAIGRFTKNSILRYSLMNDNEKSILDLDLSEVKQDLLLSLINQGFSDHEKLVDKTNLGDFLEEVLDRVIFDRSKNSLFKFALMNDVYRIEVAEHVQKINKIRENAFKLGMINGSTFITALENKGYRIKPFRHTFIKKVNIVPQFCIYDDKRFKWNEGQQNIYKIEAIEFDLTKLLHTEESGIIIHNIGDSKHPNTCVDNYLCLGDLYGELKNILKSDKCSIGEFGKFIDLIESTLNIVNFDSAYEEIDRDWDDDDLDSFLTEVKDFTDLKVVDKDSFIKL